MRASSDDWRTQMTEKESRNRNSSDVGHCTSMMDVAVCSWPSPSLRRTHAAKTNVVCLAPRTRAVVLVCLC